jgi:hypothetical protein
MSIFTKLLSGDGGVIGKVTGIVSKSIVDKDKRNEMIYDISLLMMQSKVAPYVRALIALIVVIGCMFFGDTITLTPDAQQWCLYSVLGYYFLDRVLGGFSKKK